MDVSDGEMLDSAIDDYRRERMRADRAEAEVVELRAARDGAEASWRAWKGSTETISKELKFTEQAFQRMEAVARQATHDLEELKAKHGTVLFERTREISKLQDELAKLQADRLALGESQRQVVERLALAESKIRELEAIVEAMRLLKEKAAEDADASP